MKIYMDGPTLEQMWQIDRKVVSGFTTNPTLMRSLGVTDYERYGREALQAANDLPVSLEVFADDVSDMGWQARTISGWGKNAVVKIPITNTQGQSTAKLVKNLVDEGINVNVTAVFLREQVSALIEAVGRLSNPVIVSVFAGRIADTGRDPEPLMRVCRRAMGPGHLLLWASCREIFNLEQASRSGCDIITMTPDQIAKSGRLYMRDPKEFSLETVKMFHDDALKSGYKI